MKIFYKLLLLSLSFAILLIIGCEKKQEKSKAVADKSKPKLIYLTIGTGDLTGVYYPSGGAIAKMVNLKRSQYHIKATVESTNGSVFNVNAMMAGELEVAVVQSDCGYQAWNGLADWKKKGKQTKLRSIFSLHPETVTLIAAVDSNINSCSQLKGKRIAVGNPGSGTLQNSIDALSTCNLTIDNIKAEGLKASEGAKMLQDGRIDAFFYTVGHPNDSIIESAAGRRKVKFIPFVNVEELLSTRPYYAKANIPIKLYPGISNTADVPTFGVKATILTSSDVSEEAIYALTKEVFDNLEQFKNLHPALAILTKKQMLEGLTAPFHKGALKYLKEVGLK